MCIIHTNNLYVTYIYIYITYIPIYYLIIDTSPKRLPSCEQFWKCSKSTIKKPEQLSKSPLVPYCEIITGFEHISIVPKGKISALDT